LDGDKLIGTAKETLKESHRWEPMIYSLMYRNPDYRELTNLIRYIFD